MVKTNKSVLALVVSRSGALQNGLLALMTTSSQIRTVLVAEDFKSALRLVENHQPSLIILDLSSSKEQDLIQELKTHWPHIHLIALVEDVAQQEAAQASGADKVLLAGFSVQTFTALIEKLLDPQEDTLAVQANTKE